MKGVGWLMFGLKQWKDLKGFERILRRSLQRMAHTKYLYRVLLRVLDST